MIAAYIEQLKQSLHGTFIGEYRWLEWFVGSVIDFLTGPFTGIRTRSYWPEVVAGVIIAAIVFVIRDRRSGQGIMSFLRYLLPRSQFIHQSTWVDCKIIIANHFIMPAINVTWRLSTPLFAGAIVTLLTAVFGPPPQLLTWSTTTIVLFTILWGIADDLGYYLLHLAMHRVGWLWAFHKVHHSAQTLQIFANVRVHPVELLLNSPARAASAALIVGPALYLGPGDAPFAMLFGMNLMAVFYGAVGAQLHHSHIWISWGRWLEHIFVSPAMHQIHHSADPKHWNRNMGGNFAFFDWIFGTIYVPRGREELTFGLGGDHQPHPTLTAAFLEPFWEVMPFRDRLEPLVPGFVKRLVPTIGSHGAPEGTARPISPGDNPAPPFRAAEPAPR